VFHFSSEAARKRFEAAPEKYAPVQSGNDVVLAAEENRTVPGNVNHSAVWHGRLYLFSNSASLAAFQKDPPRYAKRVRQVAAESPAP
jgi:YHS domain-containing protein